MIRTVLYMKVVNLKKFSKNKPFQSFMTQIDHFQTSNMMYNYLEFYDIA